MPTVEEIINAGPPNGDAEAGRDALRDAILSTGIASNSDGLSDDRIYVWTILLRVPPIPTDQYLDLVRQGQSPAYAKIRNDTFRTLTTDPLFRRRVTENSLTRVLNAVAWKLHDAHESRINGWASPPTSIIQPASAPPREVASNQPAARFRGSVTEGSETGESASGAPHVGYVQGMNVLAAPFLYAARSEAEAFAIFDKFITQEAPGYVDASMRGVHRGVALVDRILEIVDPRLAGLLAEKGLGANIWAFPSVLTMSACTPPLPEVLQLWDFLFAFGVHMNLFCVAAQVVIIRDELLSHPTPSQLLRNLPPLRARTIKVYAINCMRKVPDELYQQTIEHTR